MEEGEPQRTILTEYEPLFDAADAIKCGRDLFIAQSSCCNSFGIEWLRRHLAPEFAVHEVEVYDTHPMHIDATFYPLAPGKLLVHPERCAKVPEMFAKAGWDVLTCPEPDMPLTHPMYNCSRWISMNVVMLDEERVIVAKGEERLISAFKKLGLHAHRVPVLRLRDDRRRLSLRQRGRAPAGDAAVVPVSAGGVVRVGARPYTAPMNATEDLSTLPESARVASRQRGRQPAAARRPRLRARVAGRGR